MQSRKRSSGDGKTGRLKTSMLGLQDSQATTDQMKIALLSISTGNGMTSIAWLHRTTSARERLGLNSCPDQLRLKPK